MAGPYGIDYINQYHYNYQFSFYCPPSYISTHKIFIDISKSETDPCKRLK